MSRSVASPSPTPAPTRRFSSAVRLGTVAAGAILAMSVVLSAFAANAHISVPAMAEPGAHITVYGTGFRSGQVGNLTYNGGVVTGFKASASGSFSAPFTIPDSAVMDDVGRISAKTRSATLIATSTLAIGPKVTAPTLFVPDHAAPGSRIVVGGAGFGAAQGTGWQRDIVHTFLADAPQ